MLLGEVRTALRVNRRDEAASSAVMTFADVTVMSDDSAGYSRTPGG
jgi:hypothetical protein